MQCLQTPRSASTFGAASLRRAESVQGGLVPLRGGPGSSDPGRVSARGIPLTTLLQRAYDLKADQIIRPAWIGIERYYLTATVPLGATPAEYSLMLPLHHETRSFSGYRLVTAKSGPKLKESDAAGPGSRGVSARIGDGKAHVSGLGGFPG
jgi:uncharacterized protein (TIGR03435 family)